MAILAINWLGVKIGANVRSRQGAEINIAMKIRLHLCGSRVIVGFKGTHALIHLQKKAQRKLSQVSNRSVA